MLTLADTLSVLMLWDKLLPMIFIGAVGCCVGSLLNVLVWRMPQNLGVVSPPSRCPKCNTRLTWRENIPVLGWVLLRGRCRFCKSPISAEYPIVEAFVGLLFVAVYWLFYIAPPHTMVFGLDLGLIGPFWARNGAAATWPTLVVVLGLFAALIAMTLIDARTFTIPIELCWFTAILGVVGHLAQVFWWQAYSQRLAGSMQNFKTAPVSGGTSMDGYWLWTLPTPSDAAASWWWIGATIGATVGLGVAWLLVRTGVLRRSFDDFDTWEKETLAADQAAAAVGVVQTQSEQAEPTDMWLRYPHGRREMVREMAYLAPAALLGWCGGWIFDKLWGGADAAGGVTQSEPGVLAVGFAQHVPPLWLAVLCGVLLGYLVGGLTVWAIRIIGTAVKGQEAMGMGDVHLLAGVGACLGWIAPVVVFWVLAPVIALTIWAGQTVFRRKAAHAMPYGPSLAAASVLYVLGRPLIEMGITAVLRAPQPIHLP
ncbi:MAG: prepilin peptidase [Phycisphaerales bacterium]